MDGLLSSADGLDRIQEVKRFASSSGSIVYRISTNKNQFRLSEEIGAQFQKGDLIALQKTPLLGIHTYVEKWEPSPLMGTKLLDVYQDRDHPFKGMIRVLRVPPSIGILNIFIFIRKYNRRVKSLYEGVRSRLGNIGAFLQDRLAGIQVTQSFSKEGAEISDFESRAEGFYDKSV